MQAFDDAVSLSSEFTGGYSYHFDDAQDFHRALTKRVAEFKANNYTGVNEVRLWFAPTCEWDTFIGKDGQTIANFIYEYLSRL